MFKATESGESVAAIGSDEVFDARAKEDALRAEADSWDTSASVPAEPCGNGFKPESR